MKRAIGLCTALALITTAPAFAGTYDVKDPAWNKDERPVEVTAADGSQHIMTAEEEAQWREGFRHAQRNAWTKFWILQGLSAADVATTCIALSQGGREANPIYGKNANCGRIAGIKGGLVAVPLFHKIKAASEAQPVEIGEPPE